MISEDKSMAIRIEELNGLYILQAKILQPQIDLFSKFLQSDNSLGDAGLIKIKIKVTTDYSIYSPQLRPMLYGFLTSTRVRGLECPKSFLLVF